MATDHPPQHALGVELHVEERGYAFSDSGPPELYLGVTIDGAAPVPFPTVVNPQALSDSLNGDGEYGIFTCACGFDEDPGITSGVQVTHGAGQVRWQADYPALDVSFASSQYRAAIAQGMARAEELVQRRPELDGWMPPRLRRWLRVEATRCTTEAEAAALFDQAVQAAHAVPGLR